MGFERLHHVQLLIPPGGEEVARAFYGGILGMGELTKPPELAKRGGCWFRGGGWELHLAPVNDFTPERKAHPGVLVDGLDDLAAVLEKAGRPVKWDENFTGYRRFHSEDDHGNRLEFLQALDENRAPDESHALDENQADSQDHAISEDQVKD